MCAYSYSTCRLGRKDWLILIRVEYPRRVLLSLFKYTNIYGRRWQLPPAVSQVVKFICYRRDQWHHEVSRSVSDQAFLARGHSLHQLSCSDLFTVGNCSELTEHGCYLCPLSWMVTPHLSLFILHQKMQGLFPASHNLRWSEKKALRCLKETLLAQKIIWSVCSYMSINCS